MKASLVKMLAYGFSIAFNKGLALLMLPLVVNYLAPQDYGRLELMVTVAMFTSVVVGFGLEEALYRYAGSEKDSARQRQCFLQIFTLSWVMSIVFGGAYLFSRYFLTAVDVFETWLTLLNLVAAIVLFEGVVAIPLAWLRMQDCVKAFCFFSVGKAVIQALLIVVFLKYQSSAESVLFAGVIATFIQWLGLALWVALHNGKILELNLHTLALFAKKSIVYCSPLVICGIIGFVLFGIDRWVLAFVANLEEVAVYSLGLKFAMGIAILMQPFQMWWNPRRFSVAGEINGQAIIARTVSQGWVFCLAMGLFVILLGPALIVWMLPEAYREAASYLPGLVVIFILKEWVELVNLGTFWGESTAVQTKINLISVCVLLVVIYPAVFYFGVWGCVLTGILVNGIRLMLYYRCSQQRFFIPYPAQSWIKISAQCLSIVLLGCLSSMLVLQILSAGLALLCLGVYASKQHYLPKLELKWVTSKSKLV